MTTAGTGPRRRRAWLLAALADDVAGTGPTFSVPTAASPAVDDIAEGLRARGWSQAESSGPVVLRLLDARHGTVPHGTVHQGTAHRGTAHDGRAHQGGAHDGGAAAEEADGPGPNGLTVLVAPQSVQPAVASAEHDPFRTGVDLVLGVGWQPDQLVAVPTERLEASPIAGPAALAAALLAHLRDLVRRPRVSVRTCAGDAERARLWGDTHFAESLAAAFVRAGTPAVVHRSVQWATPDARDFDVTIHLRGLFPHPAQPGATNVVWVISHPEAITDEELAAADLVVVASSSFAATLRARTATPVHVLHQATDLRRFRPVGERARRAVRGIVVVESRRWPTRTGPRWLTELGWDFSLYGGGWHGTVEASHWRGAYVPNDEVADVYAQADVVVADQWEGMTRHGFLANRLFDVAASGGFAITDAGSAVGEVFGDAVPTFTTRGELHALLQRFMADPGARDRHAQQAMRIVRTHHGFDRRVRQLEELLAEVGSPVSRRDGGPADGPPASVR